jgi:hypothetical protein
LSFQAPVATLSSLSPQLCTSLCRNAGYSYAGLQNGTRCSCGDVFGSYGPALSNLCNIECPGDNSQRCGGSLYNSIFLTDFYVPPPKLTVLSANAYGFVNASATIPPSYIGPELSLFWTLNNESQVGTSVEFQLHGAGIFTISCTASNAVMSATTTTPIVANCAPEARVEIPPPVASGTPSSLCIIVLRGYFVNLTFTTALPTPVQAPITLAVPNPTPSRVGPSWSGRARGIDPVITQYLVVAAAYPAVVAGVVEAIEVDAVAEGVLSIGVLRPRCSVEGESYCPSLRACALFCPVVPVCSSGQSLCTAVGACLSPSACTAAEQDGLSPPWQEVDSC